MRHSASQGSPPEVPWFLFQKRDNIHPGNPLPYSTGVLWWTDTTSGAHRFWKRNHLSFRSQKPPPYASNPTQPGEQPFRRCQNPGDGSDGAGSRWLHRCGRYCRSSGEFPVPPAQCSAKFITPVSKSADVTSISARTLLYAKCPVKSMIKTHFFRLFYSIH